jgi:hypothetical protein
VVFIQIIEGRCTRQAELRALADAWRDEVGPTAEGWLGGTYGFTDDDMFVGVVRFTDRDAAMRNSGRPEQQAWAEKMAALMDGSVEFHDCDDVTLMMGGGSDDAGFVQVIRGKVADPSRMKAIMYGEESTAMLHEARPDILGGTLAFEPDGTFIETIAFTSEAAAREGESKEMPDMPHDVRATLEEAMQGATFYDLHHPWFATA